MRSPIRAQKLVSEGVAAARASQDLLAQIAELERTARLYNVLNNDKNMLDVYRTKDEGLSATRAQLDRQLRAPAAHQALELLGPAAGNDPPQCHVHVAWREPTSGT